MKKLYINDIQRLYRVISSIANLKQPDMDLSSYGGWISGLKDELASILSKSTNVETSQSKMDRVFIIFFCLTSGQILRTSRIRYSLEKLSQTLMGLLLGYFAIPPPQLSPYDMRLHHTSVIVSQSHSRSDSRGGSGSSRGRGQRSHCKYCYRLGHTRD